MSRTPRGLINGTALVTAVIMIIVAVNIFGRACSSSVAGHEASQYHELPPDTIPPASVEKDSTERKSSRNKPRQPVIYPERSPMDEIL